MAAPPTAWSWENPDSGGGLLDVEALRADLQAQLDAIRNVRATDPINSFRAVMEYAEPTCPSTAVTTTTEDAGSTYYFDNLCSTRDMIFKGPALLHTWVENRVEPIAAMEVAAKLHPDILWTGYGFNGQTDIFSTDGGLDFNCSCTMVDIVGTDSDGTAWFFGVTQGPAHYTGPEGEGSWMEDAGIDPAISVTVSDGDGARSVELSSASSGIGERYDAVNFTLMGLAGHGGGTWNCAPDALTMTIAYRDSEDASWWSMSLTSRDSSCALCGDAPNGEELCLDPHVALLDWEISPWL